MTCPSCRLENIPSAEVCDCGYALTAAGRARTARTRRPCPYCKEMIQPDAALCPHCRQHISPLSIRLKFVEAIASQVPVN
jgi:hypothetical protein